MSKPVGLYQDTPENRTALFRTIEAVKRTACPVNHIHSLIYGISWSTFKYIRFYHVGYMKCDKCHLQCRNKKN